MNEIRTAMVLVVLLSSAGVSLAQHEGHRVEGAPPEEGACLAHAKEGLRIVENANRQLEEARQTNSPQQMRGAISGLQATLAEIRTQLSLCVRPGATPGMEGLDHSRTLGDVRDVTLRPSATTGGGADVTLYRFTNRLDDVYSTNPVSFHVFTRIRFDIGMGGGHAGHTGH